MAFYIDLEKIKETEDYAQYRFYSIKGSEGVVQIAKETGSVKELKQIERTFRIDFD